MRLPDLETLRPRLTPLSRSTPRINFCAATRNPCCCWLARELCPGRPAVTPLTCNRRDSMAISSQSRLGRGECGFLGAGCPRECVPGFDCGASTRWRWRSCCFLLQQRKRSTSDCCCAHVDTPRPAVAAVVRRILLALVDRRSRGFSSRFQTLSKS